MTTKTKFLSLALLVSGMTLASAQPILLAGFDGTQTQNTIAPATVFSNSGVRELVNPVQGASAAATVGARIWTDQVTGKEFQWTARSNSTNTLWGTSALDTAPTSGTTLYIVTQQNASWINFEISNIGTGVLTLDKFHINALREGTGSPTELTISLEQNGTFANPPVLSASDLTATGSKVISLAANTSWNGYEFALSDMLSDVTLAAGEMATFRIANNAGTARMYFDNVAISGTFAPVPEPSAALLGGLGLLALLRRRRRS